MIKIALGAPILTYILFCFVRWEIMDFSTLTPEGRAWFLYFIFSFVVVWFAINRRKKQLDH